MWPAESYSAAGRKHSRLKICWAHRENAYVPARIAKVVMKIAAAQITSVPGDLEGNLRTVRDFASRAKESGAELIVFPEMIDAGYSMPAIQKHGTS